MNSDTIPNTINTDWEEVTCDVEKSMPQGER